MFNLIEKEKQAIERLKAFAPKTEPYYLCYSGGKDSDTIRILAKLADVPHEIHHNLTTVDAPETVQYIKTIPEVIIDKARYEDGTPKTMWNLMVKKRMPPTRIARWCCTHLKEHGGEGRLKITGVRWSESSSRSEHSADINIIGKPKSTEKRLSEMGFDFRITKQGGIAMSVSSGDNSALRSEADIIHQCYKDRSVTVNPIVDWSDTDVWSFLHYYGVEGNPLYQCNHTRIGCIGCPMAGYKKQRAVLALYPKYKANYIRAFDNMLKARIKDGLPTEWKNGIEVMKWWTGEDTNNLTMFSDDELYEIMNDIESR